MTGRPPGRQRILAATEHCLRAGRDVRIAEIASAADVSPALVYKHFVDRDDLVAEAYAEMFAGLARDDIALLREVAADPAHGADETAVEQTVLMIARRTLAADRDDVRWGRLEALAQARRNPLFEARVEQVRAELVEAYTDLIDPRPPGVEHDPDAQALAIIGSGLSLGITAMAGADLPPQDRERLARLWARMFALAVTRR